jgi:hypothetical protein
MEVIYIFIIALVIILFSKNLEGLENEDLNAAEMCKKISTKAEEIESAAGGIANIFKAFNPLNALFGGKNESSTDIRNIIKTNLSDNDIAKIKNSCSNSSLSSQSNIIDNSACKWCETNDCSVNNVQQSNTASNVQTCMIQSSIELLLKKNNSVDSQALAEVLQKSSGLGQQGNKSKSNTCNITSTDMSSNRYLEQISQCANDNSIDQENILKTCGSLSNVIQKNTLKNIQDCIVSATTISSSTTNNDSSNTSTSKTDQESKGFDLNSMVFIAIFVICSLSICISLVFFMFSGGDGGGDQNVIIPQQMPPMSQMLRQMPFKN